VQAAIAQQPVRLTAVAEVALAPADRDADGDGLTDLEEVALGTSWTVADTDGDGLGDGDEVAVHGTDPLRADTDGDFLGDARELAWGADPLLADSDGDGLADSVDVAPSVPSSDPFVVDDVDATDRAYDVRDPEFDELGQRVAWQDADGSALWAADVDPQTGRFVPFDGRGAQVDAQVMPMEAARNGPEWAYGLQGDRILYSKEIAGVPALHAAVAAPGGGWRVRVVQGTSGFIGPIGSLDPGDPSPRTTWIERTGQGLASGWMDLGDPNSIQVHPQQIRYGRWVPGTRDLVYVADAGGIEQVHTIDADSGQVTQLTFDLTWKSFVFLFRAPEYGDELRMFVAEGDVRDAATRLAVWAEAGGVWSRVHELPLPPGFPYVISPEPLRWGGRAYVTWLASTEPENSDNGVATVWVGATDPAQPLVRLVSESSRIIRKDPEPYAGGSRPWVYYTELTDAGQVVRRCEVGL
jgi:hypothetical protein